MATGARDARLNFRLPPDLKQVIGAEKGTLLIHLGCGEGDIAHSLERMDNLGSSML
jgi:hypothetical protein